VFLTVFVCHGGIRNNREKTGKLGEKTGKLKSGVEISRLRVYVYANRRGGGRVQVRRGR